MFIRSFFLQTGLNAIIQTTPKSSELLMSRLFFLSDLVVTFTPSQKARYLPEAQISLQTNIIMYFSSEKHITVFLSARKSSTLLDALYLKCQHSKRLNFHKLLWAKTSPEWSTNQPYQF